MTKILVCGSRNWTDEVAIAEYFLELDQILPKPIIIIHGKARGADTLAGELAKDMGWKVQEFPAEWDKYGKMAGYKRNIQMLDEKPDLVVAFWNGKSNGTRHTINEARKRGIQLKVTLDSDNEAYNLGYYQ